MKNIIIIILILLFIGLLLLAICKNFISLIIFIILLILSIIIFYICNYNKNEYFDDLKYINYKNIPTNFKIQDTFNNKCVSKYNYYNNKRIINTNKNNFIKKKDIIDNTYTSDKYKKTILNYISKDIDSNLGLNLHIQGLRHKFNTYPDTRHKFISNKNYFEDIIKEMNVNNEPWYTQYNYII